MQQQQKHHRHNRSTRQPLIEVQPGQVAFRVVCHVSKIDGLISHSGSVITRIRVETGCLVHCEEAVKGSEHRAFVVVGSASPERKIAVGEGETVEVSGAQEAVIMFLERMWGVDAKKDGGEHEGYCGLLANTSQIGAVVGREGRNIKRMERDSGAHIRILPAPLSALKEDQLIQITGSSTVAVKNAVIDVTSYLQDCPQYKKDGVDLSLRAVRRRSGSSGEPPCSLLPTHSENITIDGSHKKPNEQLQVQFRMICSHGAAGSIIGKGGSIVRALQNETGASITLAPPISNSADRLVTVSASENPESSHSPAQNALLLVVARSIEHDIEKARCMGLIGEISVTATLLLPSNRVSCLIGRGGRIDSETIEATGADIQILQGDQFFDSASKNDVVVQITGEEKNVQNALFQITCKLRDNLLPTGMLNGSRSGNPNRRAGSLYRRAGEITKLHQTACKSLDSNQETSLEIRVDQITGSSTLAVKRAVIDVTTCLQEYHPYKKDEVDLSLGAVRRRNGSSSEPPRPLLPTHSEIIAADGSHKKPNEQFQVQFRMICSHGAAGSVIGTGGSIVRAMQNETGASITFAPPITNSDDRLVTVSAMENLESSHSPAQNALVLVFSRSIEHDIEKARSLGLIGEISVTATLLLPSNRVTCLIGRGGRIDAEMKQTTGADIQIFQGDQFPDFASMNDVVVQITGEEKNVQNALFQVTSKLRENLLPTEMLNGLRAGSPYRKEGGIAMLHRSVGESLNSNQERNMKKRVDQVCNTPSSLLQLPQKKITGRSTEAVKKAVIDVTSWLQDCPPYKEDEVDLSLGAFRRRSGSSSESPCSVLPTHSENIAVDGSHKKPNEQLQVQFRMICSHGAAGSVIGTGGSIIRALQNETGASITFAPPITNSDDRLVTVSAMENLESSHSPAQNALVLVFARSIEHDIEKARSLGLIGEISVTATLLLPSNRVTCLIGRGGRIVAEMIETTGADIQILQGDQFLDFASMNDVVVEISGEYKNVQDALFQVTSKLRDNLLSTEMRTRLRAGSPCRRAGEITTRRQSAGSISRRNSQFPSANKGRATYSTDNDSSSNSSDKVSESEMALHFLHPQKHHRLKHSPRKPLIELQPGQVAFRVVCHVSKIGALIGYSGSVISRIRVETGCLIHCEEAVKGSEHRAILVVGSASPERKIAVGEDETVEVSAAQEAVVRVLERMWEMDAQKDGGDCEGYCGLLANMSQIGAVVGREGRNIKRMKRASGAHIWILPAPLCASSEDQLIQITGSSTVAVKKAVIDVTSCLQDCTPYEKDEVGLSLGTVRRRSGSPGDPHAEFFPHLCSLLPTYSGNIATDGDHKKPNEQLQVQFRMICSHGAAGSIIGKGGSIVRALQNETGASITLAPITNSADRLVTVSASENPESSHSPAQTALLLVVARSIEHDIEKARSLGLIGEISVTATLLLPSNSVSCLIGRGGRIDSEMIETTGADIQILQGDRFFNFASKNDVVLQITGGEKKVQNALFQVTGKLRDNLLPTEMLTRLRAGSPHKRAGEISRLHQSSDESLDSNQETSFEKRVDQVRDPPPSSLLPLPQKLHKGQTTFSTDNGSSSTTSGKVSELERALHFLLPRGREDDDLDQIQGRKYELGYLIDRAKAKNMSIHGLLRSSDSLYGDPATKELEILLDDYSKN
ncbi:hypothetical protein DKX38_010926 [Salix brachista]|uniref:K Homology domain-containing protein n=1 Tax=Salix brachista TaxID=2182728 RepID=A0A5N5LXW1_9ROSI|nr:hypothetical protein DKX38_010926 [Salix brachista]